MFFERKELSLEEMIEKEVNDRKEKGSNYSEYDLIADVAPLMLLVNPPLAVVFTLGSLIISSYEKKEKLDKVVMPDTWLKKVAESEKISSEGLAFWLIDYKKNGAITVSDAIKFLEQEEIVKQKELLKIEEIKTKEEKISNLQFEGALSILEKANKQSNGLYNSTINVFKQSTESISELGTLTKDLGNKGLNIALNIFNKEKLDQ